MRDTNSFAVAERTRLGGEVARKGQGGGRQERGPKGVGAKRGAVRFGTRKRDEGEPLSTADVTKTVSFSGGGW